MPNSSFEIRLCESCGLRYPLVEGHPFGQRCPVCMGSTHLVLTHKLITEPVLHSPREITNNKKRDAEHVHLCVLLDNIRSAWNVGSILRSADGFGFTHAYLCGITPSGDHEAVGKTSLGAEDTVPWSYHKDAVRLVRGLKSEGWKIYALEEDPRSIPLGQAAGMPHNFGRNVLILGSEVTGVDPELLELCDQIFYIPMQGEKKSFNVAIAFGIAAFALSNLRVEK